MKFWIGVIGSNTSLKRLLDEHDKWFCFPLGANEKDRIVMYKTRRLSNSKNGFFATYFVGSRHQNKDSECTRYGSRDLNLYSHLLESDKVFNNPISISKIKDSKIFFGTSFISKNAQGSIFEISKNQFDWILENS